MELPEADILQIVRTVKQIGGDDLLQLRRTAQHNLQCAETKYNTKQHRIKHGFPLDAYWNNSERNLDFAKLLVVKIEEEIERRKIQPTINVEKIINGNNHEYYGSVIQQIGDNNTVIQQTGNGDCSTITGAKVIIPPTALEPLPKQKSKLVELFNKYWWGLIIPLAIGVLVVYGDHHKWF